jgi:type VI secretion system protein ImpH
MGPLPRHLTDEARQRERDDDPSLVQLASLFVNRFCALSYRAWVTTNQAASFDRCRSHFIESEAWRDPYTAAVIRLSGYPLPAGASGDSVPLAARAFFSGRLTSVVRNPDAIASVISHFFGVPATVEEFVGRWMTLPESLRFRTQAVGGHRLGQAVLVGARVWDPAGAFRLRLGPMSMDDYLRLLPDGRSAKVLADWMQTLVGREYDYEVQLVLRAADVPAIRFGADNRLGWTTWIKTKKTTQDRDDLICRTVAEAV